jgi:HupE / UreJ protein
VRRVLAALIVCAPCAAAAHDIPAQVTVQAFVKPEGQRLILLVRAPLGAMRDVEFPMRGPGYLDLGRAGPSLQQAASTWLLGSVRLYEDGRPLEGGVSAVRVSLPSDGSFGGYAPALAHLAGPPLPADTELYWNQALIDAAFEYPIAGERSELSVEPDFQRLGLRVTTIVRFLPPGRPERVFEFGEAPGLVRLDPRWHQSALRFVELGFLHILDGTDHLLFLVCMVIPYRRIRTLVAVATAFTLAHSVTLIASATGLAPGALWFPPLIETLIAVSIVYMAAENIVGPSLQRRWLVAFGFGLVHGFGFSFALRQSLQLAGTHLLTALVSFNVGVELGQLAVLAVLVPALEALFRLVVAERIGTIVLSALVMHTAWHWMIERGERLRQFRFAWPQWSLVLVADALRWAMLLLALGGLAWLMTGALKRFVSYRDRPAV